MSSLPTGNAYTPPAVHGRQHIAPRADLKLNPLAPPPARQHGATQYVPGQVLHASPTIVAGRQFHQADTYAPRQTLHPAARLQLTAQQTCCPCETPATITPSPFVAPWENLPYPGTPTENGARHTVKNAPDCSDVSATGKVLDLFL